MLPINEPSTMSTSLTAVSSSEYLHVSFAEITAPMDPQRFLSEFWTREAVFLRGGERTFDRYCGWNAVNAILNAGDCVFPKIKVSRRDDAVPADAFTTDAGGQRIVDARAVVNLFRDGASFGITGADSHWPPLRSVVDGVHDALLESVHANIYCSPPNLQGFQCHYDLHEVFVLQVEGAKRWRVFRPILEAPIEGWRREDAAEALQTDPYIDVVLRKGDVLYVPRGHWHYAVAQDSISVHVTLGVTCRKGTTFLDWLAAELSRESTWRRNTPLMSGVSVEGHSVRPVGFTEWSNALRRSLVEKLSDATLFERFFKDTVTGMQPLYTVEMPLQGMSEPLPIDRLVFERPSGRRHVVEQSGASNVVISVAGSEIQLEGVNPTVIRRIFASESFTLADIRAWDPTVNADEVSELLSEFIRAGLLLAGPAHSSTPTTVTGPIGP
jgi:ribosomal protein L16 Arg81 hydroxylase